MEVQGANHSMGVVNKATGTVAADGTILVVRLGFTPRTVKIINITDVIVWEKHHNMAASTTLKTVAAGTKTADTTTAITIGDRQFSVSAAAAANGKTLLWEAQD